MRLFSDTASEHIKFYNLADTDCDIEGQTSKRPNLTTLNGIDFE